VTNPDVTISALHAKYAAGVSPNDILRGVLARQDVVGDPGIFIYLATREELERAAAALGPFDPVAKPLWGVPFAVKDNIDVAGMPTTAACQEFAYTPEVDAAVVARLKAAGAIVVGKTNLDQFATGLVGVRTPFPVPRNALDDSLVPGGSSSGSAVATAQGIVTFALGTDTAGSGRVPAALNGIVGLKPSLGALSTTGVVPACRTLDCVSIFASELDDAWTVFAAAAAHDESDPYSLERDVLSSTIGGKPIIGIPSRRSIRFFGDKVQQEAFEKAVLGVAKTATIVEVDFDPLYAVADMLYEGAWVAERLAAIENFAEDHEAALHPVTAQIILGARSLTAADAFKGFYKLQELKSAADALLAGLDMLLVPTIPTVYTRDELAADPIGPNSRFGTYTNFVNLLDMSGLAIPYGSRSDGKPFGVTLLGKGGADRVLAEYAAQLLGVSLSHSAAVTADEEIELVVVGAHLSGMPLNSQLTDLKAKLLRATRTAPDYQFFALPTAPVAKPGLLRIAAGQGAAIEVEVWSLSPEAFGKFVAAIPSPLGIGKISLADGTIASGFLVEAHAVTGAEEISACGSWRAFMAR